MAISIPRTAHRLVLIGALAVTVPGVARAQDTGEDAEILRIAQEHYKQGREAFKQGKYAEAIKALKKAHVLSRKPALLINIALTYEKLNDLESQIYFYKKYLAEAPPDAKDRDAIKQKVAELEVKRAGGGQPTEAETEPAPVPAATRPRRPPPAETAPPAEAEPPPEEAPPPRRPRHPAPVEAEPAEAPPPAAAPPAAAPAAPTTYPTEWSHTPIDAVPPEQPIDVRVALPVMKGVKVYLYYRGKGQADFAVLEMKRRGSEKVARIPAGEVQGTSLQYYIEAKDKAGTVIRNSGSATDPNIVIIDAAAPPQVLASYRPRPGEESRQPPPDVESEDAPPEEAPPPRRVKRSSEEEEAPLGRDAPPPPRRSTARRTTERPTEREGQAKLGTLGIVGIALAGAGAATAIGGGFGGFITARNYANAVRADACPDGEACPGANDPFIFNDPSEAPNDASFQRTGKAADLAGIITVAGGGALAAAGVALIVVDQLKRGKSEPKARPRDEATAPRWRSRSRATSFVAAPLVGRGSVGLTAGIAF